MVGSIDYISERYCEGCEHKKLEVVEERLYGDDTIITVCQCVKCIHADLCANLWDHLLDWDDEHGHDDDDDTPPDEDPDWTFSPSASYEDRQIR